jgi:hypothetical protein
LGAAASAPSTWPWTSMGTNSYVDSYGSDELWRAACVDS